MKTKRKASNSEKPEVIEAVDLSVEALNKKVKELALSDWMFKYGILTGLGFIALGVVGIGAAIGIGNFLFILIGAAALCGMAWSLIKNLFVGKQNLLTKIVSERNQYLERVNRQKQKRLKVDLVDEGCPEGARQLEELEGKFNSFEDLLHRMLSREGLTFGRYHGTTQQVFQNALSNLEQVVACRKSISDIYVDQDRSKLAQLEKEDRGESRSAENCRKRIALYEEQVEAIKNLLLENEEAMTAIDTVTVNLTRMKKGDAEIDMNIAMQEVFDLAKRAFKYARTGE